MARLARIIAAGIPHHVIQRGNRHMPTFFSEVDYRSYIDQMAQWCRKCRVDIWAYCLMPNHVHLVAVPESEDGLRRGIGEAHRRYSRMINLRENWRGHLWQGRFASYPMDERHLLAAARYMEMNPVAAGLVSRPEEWPWSSARAHLSGQDDDLVRAAPLLEIAGEWSHFLSRDDGCDAVTALRKHERTGRPLGSVLFVEQLEQLTNRSLKRRKPGPKAPRHRPGWQGHAQETNSASGEER